MVDVVVRGRRRGAVVGDAPLRLPPLVRQAGVGGGAPATDGRTRLRDEVLGQELAVQVLVQHLLLQADALLLGAHGGVIASRHARGLLAQDLLLDMKLGGCSTVLGHSSQIIFENVLRSYSSCFRRSGIHSQVCGSPG